jgi:hypothetical protein
MFQHHNTYTVYIHVQDNGYSYWVRYIHLQCKRTTAPLGVYIYIYCTVYYIQGKSSDTLGKYVLVRKFSTYILLHHLSTYIALLYLWMYVVRHHLIVIYVQCNWSQHYRESQMQPPSPLYMLQATEVPVALLPVVVNVGGFGPWTGGWRGWGGGAPCSSISKYREITWGQPAPILYSGLAWRCHGWIPQGTVCI